ncbi:MAG: DUF3047 domain-containing protein [Deltaproteobacteria bacterium]|nr:DUF3047 domain-containing protein [Deltaproteobacteria bacterium]
MMNKTALDAYWGFSAQTFRRFLFLPYLFAVFSMGTALMLIVAPSLSSQDVGVLLREDFSDLENWRSLYFPKISRHTSYTVEDNGTATFLRAEGDGSASALVYQSNFNVYDYPMAKWRWKVENIYQNTDPETKSGDDYSLRIYILFRYNPEMADFFDKVKYGLAKTLYGEYPPHSTLSYVWANSEEQDTIITSPYTDRARLVALKKGNGKTKTWQDEEVNILEDYRKAFQEDPPALASIAVMNDSDNSGQKSVSFLDYIEVFAYANQTSNRRGM